MELKKDGEFSVWWDDPEGSHHNELRFVTPERAVEMALSLAHRPAAHIGIIQRVIITDGGDFTVFEWKHKQGIVFPPITRRRK